MTIIYGQCGEATKTKITLGVTYAVDCQEKNTIKFFKRVRAVCFGSNNRGLSFVPYKQVIAVKLMNNYSNNKPHDSYGFKKEVKIKYDVVKKGCRKVPKRNRSDD